MTDEERAGLSDEERARAAKATAVLSEWEASIAASRLPWPGPWLKPTGLTEQGDGA